MINYFFLVPVAIAMGFAGLLLFLWTLHNGQYDDLEGAAERILLANEGPVQDRGEEPLS